MIPRNGLFWKTVKVLAVILIITTIAHGVLLFETIKYMEENKDYYKNLVIDMAKENVTAIIDKKQGVILYKNNTCFTLDKLGNKTLLETISGIDDRFIILFNDGSLAGLTSHYEDRDPAYMKLTKIVQDHLMNQTRTITMQILLMKYSLAPLLGFVFTIIISIFTSAISGMPFEELLQTERDSLKDAIMKINVPVIIVMGLTVLFALVVLTVSSVYIHYFQDIVRSAIETILANGW